MTFDVSIYTLASAPIHKLFHSFDHFLQEKQKKQEKSCSTLRGSQPSIPHTCPIDDYKMCSTSMCVYFQGTNNLVVWHTSSMNY